MSKSAQVASKLHAVTQIRSGIGRPYWEKRTLKALGLNKINKTVVHKNTPTINGMIHTVHRLVKVQPVKIIEGQAVINGQARIGPLLCSNGKAKNEIAAMIFALDYQTSDKLWKKKWFTDEAYSNATTNTKIGFDKYVDCNPHVTNKPTNTYNTIISDV
ncbi:39S ribosomal protein L30, mitochondrial [Trichoplax sp. H2]|uniref:Large ribosomal subunit protein uL30m n=1 Tax=Trichoplax adhaerens TaxID=10228 RepID=B3RXU4_TRIAD|nr:hypothetical protein TRIADDRAFT_56333 [Trichoplax adhaerens]EDV24916.1 hypothetical protein TRIADDRAFT_56333 [Trichoplax adhaerens]RDD46761.1 39S ribosomal protein L30, mitochondrial [Trichoplax sp. H2]|eukprot:XP_002112806.1 hypothetical protein TRIADDRAFT_56333 [Trichoplax adhaerens]